MDGHLEYLSFSPLRSPDIRKKYKPETPSPVNSKTPSKKSKGNNNITGSSDCKKSMKRKRSLEDFELPQMKDIVIKMEESSPDVTPKKAHRVKSSSIKKSSLAEHRKKYQNNSVDILENCFKKSNSKSPSSMKSLSSMFSPVKDTPLKSREFAKKKSVNVGDQSPSRLSFSPESIDLGSPRSVNSMGDSDDHPQNYDTPISNASSRKSNGKSEKRQDIMAGVSPRSSQKHSSLKSPYKTPEFLESSMSNDSDDDVADRSNDSDDDVADRSPKTPNKLSFRSPTGPSRCNESDFSMKSPSDVVDIQNKARRAAVDKMLSYKCPESFLPFSSDTSALEFVSSEDCNLDNCKLFLIKAPADFPVEELPKKIILNAIQSFHHNETPFEVRSFVDDESQTSSLISLVHNSKTGQLKQGPPFVGQIHVMQSLSVPSEASTSPSSEPQRVPFPEGLHIRYTPFGSADPVCFSTEHHLSKKKRKKSKHVNVEVTDSAYDSSTEKKKKKKKKNKNKKH